MHQSRAEVTTKIPIPRKGTKYVARSLSHLKNSVPVVIAVRDMLKLARTTDEVKRMIHQKALKINGKEVKDQRESIKLFNIFEADKTYFLTLTKTNKFILKETKSKERICKIVNKTLLRNKKIQLNLHDGSNILSSEKFSINDTIYITLEGEIIKHIPFEPGKTCFIISGKYAGFEGKIDSIELNKSHVKINDRTTEILKRSIVAL